MFKWSSFPFLRLTVYFILGILLYEYSPQSIWQWSYVVVPLLVSIYIMLNYSIKSKLVIGVCGLIIFIYLGGITAFIHDEKANRTHFSNLELSQIQAFSGKITNGGEQRGDYSRYEVRLSSVLTLDFNQVYGKIHLYIKSSKLSEFKYGDGIIVSGRIVEVMEPKNPNEFNYRQYLERKNIYGQCFTEPEKIKVSGNEPSNPLKQFAISLRRNAEEQITCHFSDGDERQIAMALMLGVKNHLDNEIKHAYSAAGAMHVLAVSGLHVGIIYIILSTVLQVIKRIKWGAGIYFLLLVVGLWMYAMFTGLSPSVMRATTMFSIIGLKDVFGRKSNVYNSIGISALVLLIADPNFLYSVGFQLSYIAVLGIVYLYKPIYEVWDPPNIVFEKIWAITSVSIAAQISTFPLTMYYFHQFPNYFIFSNWIVIPGVTVILIIAIPFLLVGGLSKILGEALGYALSKSIHFLNQCVFFIEDLPYSLVTWLHIEFFELLAMYGIIIMLFGAFQYKSFIALFTSLVLIGFLFSSVNIRKIRSEHENRIVLYSIPGKMAIDLISGKQANLYVDDVLDVQLDEIDYKINPYRRYKRLGMVNEASVFSMDDFAYYDSLRPVSALVWQNTRILFLHDSPERYVINPIETDVLILTGSHIKSFTEIPSNIKYDHLVISSDYNSFLADKICQEATEMGVKIHSVQKDGYWTLDLS